MARSKPRILWRPLLKGALLGSILGLLLSALGIAADALAQSSPPTQAPTIVQQGDTFPAALGYAALAVATTIWGTLSLVVKSLWSGREIDRAANQAAIDTVKKECRDENTVLRDKLEKEVRERREEAERLLREQRDIMREVVTTSATMAKAIAELTEAVRALKA